MNKEELKSKIIDANKAYRSGNSIISDGEYDSLVEEFEKKFPDEYDNFRNSLNEGSIEHGTKIKHPYVMGSLDKIKNTDQKTLSSYLKKYIKSKLNVSAKVDGISCRIRYVDGKIESASTRGDGYEGILLTDKIKFVQGVPEAISYSEPIDIRGELVILNSEDVGSMTNRRNICAGYINRKEWNASDISKVSFIPYTILGSMFTKNEQFELLEELGFDPAWHKNIDVSEATLENLTNYAKIEHEYQCDGLVLIDENAKNEQNVYRPKNSMAFKINEISGISKVIDVSWDGPSANGRFVPVAVVEPIILGDATISRASMHNLDVMSKLGVKYGSVVEVTKNNDIIPQIARVVSNDNAIDIELPKTCPSCGEKLVKDESGLYMVCKNKDCKAQVVVRLAEFIKKLGVMNASEKTLDNFGIHSFDSLLSFKANPKYKSQVKLEEELYNKMFSRSKIDLLYAMDFTDIAKITLEKIVEHYGFNNIEGYIVPDEFGNLVIQSGFSTFLEKSGLPSGVGEITLNKFKNGFLDAFRKIYKITSDIRWHYSESDMHSSRSVNTSIVGSICVTGSLNFGSRSKFLEYAKEHGYESKSGVSKGLTYLVNNDINSNSSKNKKAKELGIKIISEADFLKIIKDDTIEQDLNDL